MSGHSKWHSIKHQKAAADSKRGAIFTRVSRNITIAARDAGSDPQTNAKLRLAIEQARAVNMPKENIERAIKRGTGEGAENQLKEEIYEAYGPNGVGIIIKAITDNTNRAVSDIRHALSKHGGTLGESGSVMWNFNRKTEKEGIKYIPKTTIQLDENAKNKLQTLKNALDELEDVNDYFTNEA
ncbi:MAG: YebC/PmpR family DNA-binding transcriptional regulator [Parcubacteria group bacterium CG22_combo_CG10-13_8_21_14_all_41_9]|nr:MAG: YebC/PmpR family DNA-binding transcriptional regulator [Parcubacteria group bacterium CG22_combo_CG10-13_8_21_14_all_41_9]